MESTHESIAPFDREYTLKDLLSSKMLLTWAQVAPRLGVRHLSVVMPDGSPLATTPQDHDVDQTIETIVQCEKPTTKLSRETPLGWITLYPIMHELEPAGYLALGFSSDGEKPADEIDATATILNTATDHIMKSTHKLAMASQVHGEVVEDSCEALRIKNTMLKASEEKYRTLAQNLDKEVKRQTEEIRQSRDRLMQQEKMASIGQLAAGVAHEINNPMGFITSNLTTLDEYQKELTHFISRQKQLIHKAFEARLLEEEELTTLHHDLLDLETRSDIDFILKDTDPLITESIDGAERIRKIVQDLKDVAHPGAEELATADINTHLDKAVNIAASELRYKATLVKEYGELPLVPCYARQLGQVFINLLVNAAQAMEEKGTITLASRQEKCHVVVDISDTGSGIPKEKLKKIFDPFFTTKPVGKGTGLGLNVVYNIIKRHHGSIGVKSELGKGTTFSIRLPVKGPARETPTP